MHNASYIIALLGALLLAFAGVARWRIARKPDQVPPTTKDNKRSNLAAMVIFAAAIISVIAAIVALFARMLR
jgi:uncharacterized membrane protein